MLTGSLNWFEYPIIAQPHHTDYSGVVWHGTYLTWLEEARVEYLRSIGINYIDLVNLGCDLPVVDLAIRYHQPVFMGMKAVVKVSMQPFSGVRLNWDYRLESPDSNILYLTAQVTLVVVDRNKGKIMRKLPPGVKEVLSKLVIVNSK